MGRLIKRFLKTFFGFFTFVVVFYKFLEKKKKKKKKKKKLYKFLLTRDSKNLREEMRNCKKCSIPQKSVQLYNLFRPIVTNTSNYHQFG